MQVANVPQNEKERLKILKKYSILDTLPEEDYDAITKIASSICETPIALVSIIDEDRQWFKAKVGLEAKETPRDYAFCAHAILNPEEIFEVADATKDERFFDNPLTTENPNVIFYAGAPLTLSDGNSLGTLCVIDNKPRELTNDQRKSLRLLANQVVNLLELRKKNDELTKANKAVTKLNESLNSFAYRLTHDLKSPLNNIDFLIDVIKQDHKYLYENTKVTEYVDMISDRISYMENLIDDLLNHTKTRTSSLEYSSFNLKELIDGIVKNIDIEQKISINTAVLNYDIVSSKIGFLQIFQNLISNSKKYSDKEKVVIEIDFFETAVMYNFVFRDNGPGIPEKYWHKVFEMFETLSTTNNSTGIGLATVKSIIERLGGNIYLSDKGDKTSGVCFNFMIKKCNQNNA